jgi:hypothetical protein
MRGNDSCVRLAQDATPPAQDAPASSTSDQSPKAEPPPLIPIEVRDRLISEAENVRDEAAAACCGSDNFCNLQFSRVKISTCNIDARALDSDCPANLAAYRLGAHVYKKGPPPLESFSNYEALIANARPVFRFDSIEVRINARAHRYGDSRSTFRHEFGHICDQISRLRDVVKGTSAGAAADVSAIRELNSRFGTPSERCELGQDATESYRRRFLQAGASPATISCLIGRIRTHPKDRFGKAGCLDICPRQHLEEAFADWFGLRVSEKDTDSQVFLNGMCNGFRDSEHMLGADELACFMRSARVMDQVRNATRCRYN